MRYLRNMSRTPYRSSRNNPDAAKAPDPYAFIAANDEAKVMATLLPAQLWRQASGAGSEWAMWELQRRGITSRAALPNPRAVKNGQKQVVGLKGYVVVDSQGTLAGYGEDRQEVLAAVRAYDVEHGGVFEKPFRVWKTEDLTGTDAKALETLLRNPRQVTGPDACSRCEGTGYAGMHGDTCSRCEGSGFDGRVPCEGGCGKSVRESKGTCDACQNQQDEDNDVVRDRFGYPMRSLGGGRYRNSSGQIVTVRRNPKLASFVGGGSGLRARDLTIHGSGPQGGYTPEERSRVPSSMFLKPQSRSWPVSDETHAHIALQYMTRGFGSHVEYPVLIGRLAQLWPVAENPDIWADYSAKKRSIEAKCGCTLPSVADLRG